MFMRFIIVGAVIMGIGSLVFVVPHFIAEVNSETLMNNKSDDNICRLPRALEQDMGGLGRLSQGLPPSNLRPDNCIKVCITLNIILTPFCNLINIHLDMNLLLSWVTCT